MSPDMHCATHPDVETGLTCNKCGKPICPRCLVQTSVGARCRECARTNKLPTFVLKPGDYVKGILAGLGAAVVCGFLWYFIRLFIPNFLFVGLVVAAGMGYAIGQAISYSVNRKRNVVLKLVAGICVLIAYVIGNQIAMPGQFVMGFGLFNLFAIAVGIYLAVTKL
jgi:hypothetical protein